MRRREFITVIGGAAAWPLAARAQRRVRRVGLLMTMAETEPEAQARLTSFRAALQQLGWTEGHNIRIDYRFAAGDPDRTSGGVARMRGSSARKKRNPWRTAMPRSSRKARI
jgi:hypothetical protein